jgi:hypothetical protein
MLNLGQHFEGDIPSNLGGTQVFFKVAAQDIAENIGYSSLYSYSVELGSLVSISFDAELLIYPNPAKDVIDVITNLTGDVLVEVINFNGIIIKSLKIAETNGRFSINTHDLPAGMYLLKVAGKESLITKRFVIR